jgi:hypothetical protein
MRSWTFTDHPRVSKAPRPFSVYPQIDQPPEKADSNSGSQQKKGEDMGANKHSTALCGRSSLLLVTNPIEELQRRSIHFSVRKIISHGGLASEVEASTHAHFSRSLVSLSLLLAHPYRHVHVTYRALDAAARWMISTGWIKTRHPALGE